MIYSSDKIRNVAIIAHVDHGKTTLVDQMLKQGGAFRANQIVADRVMDSNDLERERGITILAKNTSIHYKDYKINIIDTPGHADFGGEVERVLKMVDGELLIVDSIEGTMPQTRFVLSKALELGHKVIVCINKVDRIDGRLKEVGDEVLQLFMELNATDSQLDSPIMYCSGRAGTASDKINKDGKSLKPLFDLIISYINPPKGNIEGPLQLLVSALDYSDYVGSLAIGRVERGKISVNMQVTVTDYLNTELRRKLKISNIYQFEGLNRIAVDEAGAGDIVCVSVDRSVTIGDTICSNECVEALPFVNISQPNVEMTFAVNDSPFAGNEGKYITSRHLRERLYRECLHDVSLQVSDTATTEAFNVRGRGEMHLAILIETMRREGYEFQVSMPKVLYKDINGVKHEPLDQLIIDVPDSFVGAVMNKMGVRKGELVHMTVQGSRTRLEFKIPSRGLFGYKSEFMTDTKGEGIISSVPLGYEEYKGDITRRNCGSLIAWEAGDTNNYGLANANERGILFVGSGVPVYEGMIIGYNPKNEDLVVNVCKRKQLTNMRSSNADESLKIPPPKIMSLEESLDFIGDDEYIEVTPYSIRMRKKILDKTSRSRANR